MVTALLVIMEDDGASSLDKGRVLLAVFLGPL